MVNVRHGREGEKERVDVYDSSSDDDVSSSSGSFSGGSGSSGSSRSSSSESEGGSGSDSDDSDGEDENFELGFWESLKAVLPWTAAGKEVREKWVRVSGPCVFTGLLYI